MSTADLTNPIFTDEAAAWAHYEATVWPDGPICPKCGGINNATRLDPKPVTRKRKLKDGTIKTVQWTRRGVHRCKNKECAEQFTATSNTVFADSHIPMHKWLLATHLICASKKGMSAVQLHRMLGFGSYRTAWFMGHRIREAMAERGSVQKLGGPGSSGITEADESYHGSVDEPSKFTTKGKEFLRSKHGRGPSNKRAIVALIERRGKARVFHVATANRETVEKIVRENVHPQSRFHTDESRLYPRVGSEFASHESVRHTAGEYARDDVHVNSAENFFKVFKTGFASSYQHCAEKNLGRYLTEYEFRYNTRTKLGVTDKERAALAIRGTVGKRLTMHQPKDANT